MVLGEASWHLLLNVTQYVATYWHNLVQTLGPAAKECGAEGVEFDWEPTFELTAQHRTKMTTLLGELNTAAGDGFDVSLDLMMWGVTGDNEPFSWRPVIDVDDIVFNAGKGPTLMIRQH